MAELTTATTAAAQAATEPTRTPAEAMQDEWFDLLPIEVKLIKYSLTLGVGLLLLFVVIFRVLPSL